MMSEKRFECIFIEDKYGGTSRRLKDNETNITYMTCDVADLMNELYEENRTLKKQLEIRTASDKYHQRMLNKWLCKNE